MRVDLIREKGRAVFYDEAERLRISVPDEDCLGIVKIGEISSRVGLDDCRNGIQSPRFGQSIPELVAKTSAKSASVIISDATRGVPTHLAAGHIIRELVHSGIALEKILFVVALGVHRDATKEEMRASIGDEFFGKVRVENHTPYDDGNLCLLGTTSRGTPVEVNRRAYECDLHLSIGKVEPQIGRAHV